MNHAFPRAASACTLALGLSLGGLAWADTATLPPGPLIDIDSTANSLGTAVDAATTKSNSLTGNSVTLTSGAVDGYAVGAINLEDTASVTGNHVYINGGTVGLNAYGGWADAGTTVGNNTVAITAGSVAGNVYGGYNYTVTTNNSVTVSGGTVGGSVYGGFSGTATGNSVTISGGSVLGNVSGAAGLNVITTASNNTVTISGTPLFDPVHTVLAGFIEIITCPPPGFCPGPPPPMDPTNNNLNLHSTGLTVGAVVAFNNLNFYLPASLSTGTPVLTVTDTANLIIGTLSGPTNSKITVQTDSASPATLHDGDAYTLIQAAALTLPTPFTPVTGTITDATGATFAYTVDVDASGNNLVLTIGSSAPPVPPSSTATVPATGPAALALLALLLAATGWLARRGGAARR